MKDLTLANFRVSFSKLIDTINPRTTTIYYTDPKSSVKTLVWDIKMNYRGNYFDVVFTKDRSCRTGGISFNEDSDFEELYSRFEVLVPDFSTGTFVPILIQELVSSLDEFLFIDNRLAAAITSSEVTDFLGNLTIQSRK